MAREHDTLTKHHDLTTRLLALVASIVLVVGLMLVPALANADEGSGQAATGIASATDTADKAGTAKKTAADDTPILTDFPKKYFSVDEIDSQTYSTKTIIPKLTVTDDDTGSILATTDYSVSYQIDSGGTWVDVTEIINAGDYKVTVTGKNDYEGETIERPFTVTGAPVTITAKDAEKDYDRFPLRQPGFEVEGMPEGDMHIFIVEMTNDSVLTYADDIDNVIATVDGVDVTPYEATAVGNYLVTARNGELRVRKVWLQISAQQQAYTYNSSPQGPVGTYTDDLDKYVYVQGLVEGDNLTSITLSGSSTAAGYLLSQIKPTDAEIDYGKATGSYDINYVSGNLIINKAPLTITANEQAWKYNGTAQGLDNVIYTKNLDRYVTVEGIQGDDSLKSITLNGKATNAGEYAGKIMPSAASVVDPYGNENLYDYDITYVGGPLLIGKAAVLIKAKNQIYPYTGSPQGEHNETYTYDLDSKVEVVGLWGSDALTSITLNGQEINVGKYADKIMPSAAEFGGATGNYEVQYAPGTLIIERDLGPVAEYKVVSGASGSWSQGSDAVLTFTFKRTVDDDLTFSHFTGIKVDGTAVPQTDSSGKVNWTAEKGSVIVSLQPSFMETLAEGDHTISATFDDGVDATAPFAVKTASSNGNGNGGSSGNSSGNSSSGTTARTGDPLQSAAALALALSAAASIGLLLAARRLRRI